jgi:hypothetical protein
MLPTNQKAENCLVKSGSIIYNFKPNYLWTQSYLKEIMGEAYHLYIISGDEIKKGDFYIYPNQNCVWHNNEGTVPNKDARKIIATTDELICNRVNQDILPQPSKSFIEKYVQEYNKGNKIEDVMVEYEFNDNYTDVEVILRNPEYVVKVNPKDNTITIRSIKNSWTREELKETLVKAIVEIGSSVGLGDNLDTKANDWINQNL